MVVVLLFLGHRAWRLKTWISRFADVVREDAAHGVGVADVHVAVEEARRDQEPAPVDDAVGADVGQLGGLADRRMRWPSIRIEPSGTIRRSASSVRTKRACSIFSVGVARSSRLPSGELSGGWHPRRTGASRRGSRGHGPAPPARSSRAAGRERQDGVARFEPGGSMDFRLTPEQETFRAQVRAWLWSTSRRTGPHARW